MLWFNKVCAPPLKALTFVSIHQMLWFNPSDNVLPTGILVSIHQMLWFNSFSSSQVAISKMVSIHQMLWFNR